MSCVYFNTSHVIVYRLCAGMLPEEDEISIHLMLLFIPLIQHRIAVLILFQYISCYCLSIGVITECLYSANFNTSHVIVYRLFLTGSLWNPPNFNTSHVIVYHRLRHSYRDSASISIHLMLLFIFTFLLRHFSFLHISIHLMLLFIRFSQLLPEDFL